jgi:PKD repeat protein
MKKAFYILAVLTLLTCQLSIAQGVGINNSGSAADPSAALDINYTDKGLLIPRMTESQRNAIPNPASGLLVFNTNTGCINLYYSNMWHEICGNCQPPSPPMVTNNGPLCTGDTLKLFATPIPNAGYQWTGPNGFSSNLQNPLIPNAQLLHAGIYSVTATVNNCTSQPGSTNAAIYATPSASFSFTPASPGVGQAVTFTPATSGASYQWSFQGGNPSVSAVQNPSVQWSSSGTYVVNLTVTNGSCSTSSTQNITVTACAPAGMSTTFNYTGSVQTWTVPSGTCSITIEAWGAQGGTNTYNASGGRGAYIAGTFTVNPGEQINIVVGQKGFNGTGSLHGGGGGGGSFVTRSGNILLIAAGGGGASYSSGSAVGQPGNASTTGGAGGYYSVTPGNGGFSDNGQGGGSGAGGGGWFTAGTSNNWCTGGQAAGGAGGISQYSGHGGYGGGGASYHGGGGGGGYTGGSGGNYTIGGGGGGSINNGTGQTNTSDVRTGNGQVIITW